MVGAHIHGGVRTYMVAWTASVGARLRGQQGGPLGRPWPPRATPTKAGQATMYVGSPMYGFPTMYQVSRSFTMVIIHGIDQSI